MIAKKALCVAALAVTLGACNSQKDRMVGGALIGGAAGTVVGGLATGTIGGAVIGGALGAAGGAAVGAWTAKGY